MTDKEQEFINDVIDEDYLSDCCSASVYCPSGDLEDCICMSCKEHCSAVNEE